MGIGTALKEARERYGITQEDMKPIINYSREMISKMETGDRNVPKQLQPILSRWSPMMAMVIAEAHTGGTLPVIHLDGDIDRHPVAMTDKAIEEGTEFLEEARKLRLVNKNSPEKLTPDDREQFKKVRMEAWEDVVCKLNWLEETAEIYGFDMSEEYRQIVEKLERAGYKKAPQKEKPQKRSDKISTK